MSRATRLSPATSRLVYRNVDLISIVKANATYGVILHSKGYKLPVGTEAVTRWGPRELSTYLPDRRSIEREVNGLLDCASPSAVLIKDLEYPCRITGLESCFLPISVHKAAHPQK
jgi:hypothetical protein